MKPYILLAATVIFIACNDEKKSNNNGYMTDEDTVNSMNDTVATSTTNQATDMEFVTKASEGGMMEVMLGKLAQSKGSSKAVKDFGKQMETDHSKANDELKALAERKNMPVAPQLSAEKQAKYEEFEKKSGKEFDKSYISFMIEDHQKDIQLFKDEATNGVDAELKNWASGKIPTLEHHLHMARQADSALTPK